MLLMASAGQADAQQLRGRLVAEDGAPIAGATITLPALRYTVTSDSTGRFTMNGSAGSTLRLSFSATGFRVDTQEVVLPRRGVVERDFQLVDADTPLPEANPSDRVLSGRVLDPQGTPLAYANVQLNGGRRFVADDSGRFRIPVNVSGGFSLLVRRIGFEVAEVKLPSMPDTALTIGMAPAAHSLPETRVTATPFRSLDLHGFYRRMADVERGINRGWFITPEELDLRKPLGVTQAVEGLPRVRTQPVFVTPVRRAVPGNHNLRIEDARGCPLTVFLDRMVIQPTRWRGRLVDETINTLITVTSVAGIEVYPSYFGAPPEYRAVDGTCGVVLIWTK